MKPASTYNRPVFASMVCTMILWLHATAIFGESRHALVIGNSGYEHIPKLVNPTNDANAVAAKLAQPGLGFQVSKVLDADIKTMKDSLRKFKASVPKGAVTLVFYAGHGVQIKGENYLLPVNVNFVEEYEVPEESLAMNTVLGALEETGSVLSILVLDCCRADPFASQRRGHGTAAVGLAAPADMHQGVFIAFATGPGSVALDGKGRNSPFTSALLDKLGVPGLSLEDVFKEVGDSVATVTGKKQEPWFNSKFYGKFSFLPGELRTNQESAGGAFTALITATLAGDLKLVKEVLGQGVDVNQPNALGETALMYACDSKARLAIMKHLLDSKADPHIAPPGFGTALSWAIQSRNVEAVTMLIKHGVNVNQIFSAYIASKPAVPVPGFCALRTAVQHKEWDIFEQLLDAGATVNADTAVAIMELSSEPAFIRKHVAKIDVKQRGLMGVTPLMACVSNMQLPVATRVDLAKWLIERGIDINAQADSGKTALGLACNNGPPEVVALLLEAGADPDIPDSGFPPITKTRSTETIRLLLKHGADPEARINAPGSSYHGWSVLKKLADNFAGDSRDEVIKLVTDRISNAK